MTALALPQETTNSDAGSQQRLGHVRAAVRNFLQSTPAFTDLTHEDRTKLARAMVAVCHTAVELIHDEEAAAAQTLSGETPKKPIARAMITSGGPGSSISNIAGTTQNILKAISFPRFVSDLINGVFRAMLECTTSQMEAYTQLLANVATSTQGFADANMSQDMARRWLAERFPQSYEVAQSEVEGDPSTVRLRDGASEPSPDALRTALGLSPTDPVPEGDPEESLLPAVRVQLARQRQQMLASMVMLGMQRIVIDSGRIDASMRFHIDASSAAASEAGTRFDTSNSVAASGSFGYGPWGVSASVQSNIGYVSTSSTQQSEETNASVDLGSAVSINFRTDQIPLDHLASQQRVELIKANTINPMAASVITPPTRASLRDSSGALRDSLKSSQVANATAPALPSPSAPTSKAPAPVTGTKAP